MSEGIFLQFYRSQAWKNCRAAYFKKAGGLCERCKAKGLIVPGEAVHHKIRLTADNLNNPDITLNFDNLELLCRSCHEIEHRRKGRRYKVDKAGRVTTDAHRRTQSDFNIQNDKE